MITTASLLYKAEKPSVCPSVCISGTLITEQCLHQLKWDLHDDVKAVPLMIRVYFYKPKEPTVHR